MQEAKDKCKDVLTDSKRLLYNGVNAKERVEIPLSSSRLLTGTVLRSRVPAIIPKTYERCFRVELV